MQQKHWLPVFLYKAIILLTSFLVLLHWHFKPKLSYYFLDISYGFHSCSRLIPLLFNTCGARFRFYHWPWSILTKFSICKSLSPIYYRYYMRLKWWKNRCSLMPITIKIIVICGACRSAICSLPIILIVSTKFATCRNFNSSIKLELLWWKFQRSLAPWVIGKRNLLPAGMQARVYSRLQVVLSIKRPPQKFDLEIAANCNWY